jgi:hypothetical protein
MDDLTQETVVDSDGATDTSEVTQEGLADQSSETSGELDDATFYEVEDIRATANDFREWKKAYEGKKSQDADYTRKSQVTAEERKKLNAEREQFSESLHMMRELEGEIHALAMGDLDKLDMEELRIHDPSEYLRVKELKEDRAKWREKLSTKLQTMQQKVAEESYKKLSALNGWDDPESGAAKYEADTKAVQAYVTESGMDQRSFAKILDPQVMTAIIEAAKYRELMKAKPTINKRVVQAPKTSKPSQSNQKTPKTLAQRMGWT